MDLMHCHAPGDFGTSVLQARELGCAMRVCLVTVAFNLRLLLIGNTKSILPNPSNNQAVCDSPSTPVLEEAARLANALASDRMGRSYLLQREGSGTVPALIAMLKAGALLAAAGSSAHDLGLAASAEAPPAVAVGDPIRQPTPPQKTRSSEWTCV